jgi:hypothetical protein
MLKRLRWRLAFGIIEAGLWFAPKEDYEYDGRHIRYSVKSRKEPDGEGLLDG